MRQRHRDSKSCPSRSSPAPAPLGCCYGRGRHRDRQEWSLRAQRWLRPPLKRLIQQPAQSLMQADFPPLSFRATES